MGTIPAHSDNKYRPVYQFIMSIIGSYSHLSEHAPQRNAPYFAANILEDNHIGKFSQMIFMTKIPPPPSNKILKINYLKINKYDTNRSYPAFFTIHKPHAADNGRPRRKSGTPRRQQGVKTRRERIETPISPHSLQGYMNIRIRGHRPASQAGAASYRSFKALQTDRLMRRMRSSSTFTTLRS